MDDAPAAKPHLASVVGERVEWHRRRRGLSRRELGAMVGHTERWGCLLESEGRGALRLADRSFGRCPRAACAAFRAGVCPTRGS
ncbi:hypothetical protein [Streptomyces sp. NPDC004726]